MLEGQDVEICPEWSARNSINRSYWCRQQEISRRAVEATLECPCC